MQHMVEAGASNAPKTRTRVAATGMVLVALVALAAASTAGAETGGYRLRVRYRETDASGDVDAQEDKQVDIALDIDPSCPLIP